MDPIESAQGVTPNDVARDDGDAGSFPCPAPVLNSLGRRSRSDRLGRKPLESIMNNAG